MMKSRQNIAGKPLAWLLTFVYFSSYVTRINFAAVVLEITTATGFEKSALSVILVGLSITYGIGQIINGIIGDHVKPQNLIFCGLCLATGMNLLLPFVSSSILLMMIVWAINGFAQAMMWPPIVKIMVATADTAMYNYSMVRISWGSSFGTIAVYLSAPLLISLFGWKGVFFTCAGIGLLATIVWGVIKSRIVLSEVSEKLEVASEKPRFHFPKMALFPMVFIALAIIFQGMIRDGVTSWMPTYLAEVFDFGNQLSIFCTVSLAIFSIICFSLANALYTKFFKNEVACGALLFFVAMVCAGIMFLFFEGAAWIAIAMMTMITGCIHGVNLMLITHVPKRFKKYGNISTVSGMVNACTYVGSAIATYGVAKLSEMIGWRYTVGVWIVIAVCGMLWCLIAVPKWNKMLE